LAEQFPSREDLILPTAFGNVLRAFEDYSLHLYGFEAIKGWSRLHGAMPKDFRELIGSNQASCDMWVSLWVVSVVLAAESLFMLPWPFQIIVAGACVSLAWFCVSRAREAAIDWGEWVKAAFDLYLPKLCKQLGYGLPKTADEVKRFWNGFSGVTNFGLKESLEQMDAYRAAPTSDEDAKSGEKSSDRREGPEESEEEAVDADA
jgi:hypothetical protein